MLCLTVLAMPRGCKGPTAIAQFGRDHGAELAHALGFLRGKTPAPSCFCELFSRLDAPSHAAAIRRLNAHPEEAFDLLDLPQPQ
jgi:hypothetical protein